MQNLKKIFDEICRFPKAREGVAAVEFALILPFMLLLYMGSIEVSQLISVDRRISAVTGAVGDLVARTNGSLTTAELADYVSASGLVMTPYSTTGLRQLITCVYVASDGTTNIIWSSAYNGATAKTANTTYALPSEITDISRDNYVIVSETQLGYMPWGGYFFESSVNLYKQFFFLPRFGERIDLV